MTLASQGIVKPQIRLVVPESHATDIPYVPAEALQQTQQKHRPDEGAFRVVALGSCDEATLAQSQARETVATLEELTKLVSEDSSVSAVLLCAPTGEALKRAHAALSPLRDVATVVLPEPLSPGASEATPKRKLLEEEEVGSDLHHGC